MATIQEQNKQIIVRFNKEFIEKGNLDVFKEIVSPQFVNRTPHEGRSPGPEGAFFFFTKVLRPAFPDMEVTIHAQIAEGDTVVTRKSYKATHQGDFLGVPATGKQVSFTVIDIIRLQDGMYVEHWANADMLGLLQQLKSPK